MKLKEILDLSREEQDEIVRKIHDKMTELGPQELVRRLKKAVDLVVPESECPDDFKQKLLESGDFVVEYKDNKIDFVELKYSYYDCITASVNPIGANAYYQGEHSNGKSLLKIDGFDEFIKMTD